MKTGIEYQLTGDRNRSRVVGYHRGPSPRNLQVGAKNLDIAHLPKRKQAQLLTASIGDDLEESITSKFTIGFEIEKNELHSSAIKEHVLMTAMETDSSCGYEAITNILPLLPPCKWRNKVFNMMHEARLLIDDEYSPSNHTCGGHITLGVKGYNGTEIAQKIKKYMPVVLALYRKRLNNGYCGYNPFLGNADSNENGIGANCDRYSVCLIKGNTIELRVPNRVTSVTQLRLRYELMYHLIDTAFNKSNTSLNKFMELVRPIITKMYDGNSKKVDFLYGLALDFDKCIKTNKISTIALNYVNLVKLSSHVRARAHTSVRQYKRTLKQVLTPKAYKLAVQRLRSQGVSDSDTDRDLSNITDGLTGLSAINVIIQYDSVVQIQQLIRNTDSGLSVHIQSEINNNSQQRNASLYEAF